MHSYVSIESRSRIHGELKLFLYYFCTFFQDLLHHFVKEPMLLLGVRWAKFRGCRIENQI
jgi:hypothetical protein